MLRDESVTEAASVTGSDSEFNELIEAVRAYLQAEGSLWIVADLLVTLCGRPGRINGAHNGSAAKLKKISAALKAAFGEDARKFGEKYLERLRTTAANFPPPTRVGGVSISVHWAAGDPETLKRAQREAERRDVALTVGFVRGMQARRDREGKPQWLFTKDEFRRAAAQAFDYAEWFETFMPKHRKELTPANLKSLRIDFAEITDFLDRGSVIVKRLLKETA